jgi:hypothetical protein
MSNKKKQVKNITKNKRSYVAVSVLFTILMLGAGFFLYTAISRSSSSTGAPADHDMSNMVHDTSVPRIAKNEIKDKEDLNQKKMIEVVDVPDEGRGHVDTKVDYMSDPPTSGKHSPHDLNFGFYDQTPPAENYVHNLEHGDIEIHYSSKVKFSDEDMQTLRDLSVIGYKGSGVLVMPNDKIDTPIVVTAWSKELKLQAVDVKSIKQFMYYFIFEGPEKLYPRMSM